MRPNSINNGVYIRSRKTAIYPHGKVENFQFKRSFVKQQYRWDFESEKIVHVFVIKYALASLPFILTRS